MSVAVVVIGRNESRRLETALRSALAQGDAVVYVDSASSDDSVRIATEAGVPVVQLTSGPMSAARARNTGASAVTESRPDIDLIQFVDGDCVLAPGAVKRATDALRSDPTLGAVCGRVVEAHPRANLFHRIAHAEWHQGEVGMTDVFDGVVMIRRDVFEEAGGYDESLVAGEDNEFGRRVTLLGHGIRRIDHVSAVHDIAMHSWSAWWRRSMRAGYCFATIGSDRQDDSELFTREYRRTVTRGIVAPSVALVLLPWTRIPALFVAARSALTFARVSRRIPHRHADRTDRMAWALNCTLAPYPSGAGVIRSWWHRATGARPTLIEHRPEPSSPATSTHDADDQQPVMAG
jgi:GT2 family glycosyltransferase